MKEVRYYLRDRNKHPRVTVVLLWEPGLDTYYRGISICSWLDPVVKKVGYHKAKGRALQAREVAEFTTGHLRSQPMCSFNAREIVEFECFLILRKFLNSWWASRSFMSFILRFHSV